MFKHGQKLQLIHVVLEVGESSILSRGGLKEFFDLRGILLANLLESEK